jgi:hypothetical protein
MKRFPPKPTRAWAGTDFHKELIRDPAWIVSSPLTAITGTAWSSPEKTPGISLIAGCLRSSAMTRLDPTSIATARNEDAAFEDAEMNKQPRRK